MAAEATSSSMLAFDHVTARYGTRVALDDADFRIEPGERVAIVGPSGAGKSTLFRLCYGAFAPTSGRVLVGGVDLARQRGAALRATRSRIAVIFQAHGLVDRLSVSQNVLAGTFGRRSSLDAIRSMLRPSADERALALESLARVGLADRAGDRAFALSGGQRQRVAIARAIAQRAQLVIADEPAASLDPELAIEIVDMLLADARARGATLLCALHQPELAQRFDRTLRVQAGRVGSPAAFEI